ASAQAPSRSDSARVGAGRRRKVPLFYLQAPSGERTPIRTSSVVTAVTPSRPGATMSGQFASAARPLDRTGVGAAGFGSDARPGGPRQRERPVPPTGSSTA